MLYNSHLNFELGHSICPIMFSYPLSRMYNLNHLRNVYDLIKSRFIWCVCTFYHLDGIWRANKCARCHTGRKRLHKLGQCKSQTSSIDIQELREYRVRSLLGGGFCNPKDIVELG